MNIRAMRSRESPDAKPEISSEKVSTGIESLETVCAEALKISKDKGDQKMGVQYILKTFFLRKLSFLHCFLLFFSHILTVALD